MLLMRSFKATMRRLFPKQRTRLNHGGRLISPNRDRRTDEESLLVVAGVARSEDDARWLLAQYGTTRAKDVLKQVARHRRQSTLADRWQQFLFRMDGHDPRDVYGEKPINQVAVTYKWRQRRD